MDLHPYIRNLREDLLAAAALGDEETRRAAALLAMIAGLIIYFRGYQYWAPNSVRMNLARRWSSWAFWLGLLNLFFFVCRLIGPNNFSMHLWNYLLIAFDFGVIAYFANWYQRNYKTLISTYEQKQKRRRYMPTPASKRR